MAQGADFRSRITLDGADTVVGDLKKIGAEGDKAFSTTGAAADNASKSVTAFSRASDLAARSMASMRQATQGIGQGFADLHQHATNFGNALNNVASNIVPRWREIVALGAAGAGAGFLALFESTAKWGHELEQNAKILGTTPGELGAIGKAARAAGVDLDTLVTGMAKFGKSMEEAAAKRQQLFGDLAKEVFGADKALAGSGGVTVFAGDKVRTFFPAEKVEQFRDAAEQAYAWLKRIGALPPNETLDRFLDDIRTKLNKGGEEAAKVRKLLSQIGADLPATNVAEQIEKSLPGFRDLFAQLKVPLIDKATGAVRSLTDVFGDFLDAFAKKSPTEQIKLITDTMGRGFLDLIPIMQKGRNGLFEFRDELKAMGGDTSAFDKEIEALSKADRALRRLDGSIAAVRKSFVVPFADVFTPLLNELSSVLTANQGQVKAWATEIANQARTVALDLINVFRGLEPQTEFGKGVRMGLDAIAVAVDVVKGAFNSLVAVFQTVVDPLNALFGANYTAQTYALAAAFLYFSGILPALAAGIRLVFAALQLIYATPFGIALAAIAAAGLLIYNNWETIGPLFQKLWDLMKSWGQWIVDQWNKFWTDPIQGIKDQWNALFDWFGQKLDQLWQKIKGASASLPGTMAGGDMPPSPIQRATGGPVPGHGSGDTVPALLTPGEFVIRKGIVDQLGAGFFSALNGGMGSLIPRGRYATGGLVATSAGPGNTVNLHLDGQSFAMRADNDVFDSLVRTARSKQMLSAGRKPGWAGGRRYGG